MASQPIILCWQKNVTGNVSFPSVFTNLTGNFAISITVADDNFTSANVNIQESEASALVADASPTWLTLDTTAISVNGNTKKTITVPHFSRLRVNVSSFVGTSCTLTVIVEGEIDA